MGSYRTGSWAARSGTLGDIAEARYEAWCEREGRATERFGLNHSELDVKSLPQRVRHMPDYLESKRFVEVIGCGADQKLKVAVFKWNCLEWWNTIHPVDLYCWDSKKEREGFLSLARLDEMVNHSQVTIGYFPEKKAYWAVPTKEVDWL